MAESPLVTELVAIVRKVGKVAPERLVTSDTRLVDDLGIDSLDLVAVFLQVQDRFDVVIEDDDVAALRTVSDLATYVARRSGPVAA